MRRLGPVTRGVLAASMVVIVAASWAPAGGGSSGTGADRARQAPGRPNILIFLTDDQRPQTMQVMKKTLRWFRSEGVRYPATAVTTPLCCPSRASIMTGQYAHNHGVVTNRNPEVLDQRATMQRYLKEAGYLTAIAGKFLNNWPLEDPPSFFDRSTILNQGYERAKWGVEGWVGRMRGYSTDIIRDRALEYLRWFERRDATPWLLLVHPFAPHGPFSPAERHRSSRVPPWRGNPAVDEVDRTDKPPFVQSQDVGRTRGAVQRAEQLRTLLAVDEMVDAVMTQLVEYREDRRTLAFFLSDNGFFWSEHGVGDKRLPYLQAVEVPLFVRWPGRLEPGSTDPRFAANIDIAPTVLEAAGIVPDAEYPVDGRSLLQPADRDHLLVEYSLDEASAIPPWASYLDMRRQYTEYYGEDGRVTFREYYDLLEDPWQLVNLLGDEDDRNDPSPVEVARLSTMIARERRCVGTTGPNACP